MALPDAPEGIRIHLLKSGKLSYEARIKRGASKPLNKTFKSVKEALNWRTAVEALIASGIDPSTVLPKKDALRPPLATKVVAASDDPANTAIANAMTVRQAIDNYLKHREQSHNKLPDNQITNYERVGDDWESFLVSDLRNEDLANYISVLLRTPLKSEVKRIENGTLKGEPKTYAEATVRKFIYAMKVAIEWQAKNSKARINEFLFDFDKKVIPAAWAGHRERRLTPGEDERLYAAGIVRGDITYTPQDWRALIGFTLETAMRQQELAMAEWKQIVQGGLKLHIPAHHTKTKTARTILLSKRAREIIELQRNACPKESKRIFHQFTSAGSICDSFASLTQRAEIDDLTFHDLRHEATSRLCESGKLTQMVIMEMTGHSSMTTFRGYVHLIAHKSDLRLD